MKIIYDDETQVALDELDKNIANRHQYLAVNFSFHWHDFHEDPILQQLQKIKSNLLSTATVKAIQFHAEQTEQALGKFGNAMYNAGEAAKASAEELRTAMEKMRPVKAPVFDELDRSHDELLPKSLAVRRMKFPDSEEEFNKQLYDHLQEMKVEVRANRAAINDECEKHLNEDTE